MISAFNIYLVMQLDSIRTFFFIGGVVSFAGSFALFCAPSFEDPKPKYPLKLLVSLAAFLVLIYALLPSTKTAAAMIVIPRILNNETVQSEAAELYAIAKDALREAAGKKHPKEAE